MKSAALSLFSRTIDRDQADCLLRLRRLAGKPGAGMSGGTLRRAGAVAAALTGPAIILQKDSTTVVRPEDTAELDPAGNLLIRIGANA